MARSIRTRPPPPIARCPAKRAHLPSALHALFEGVDDLGGQPSGELVGVQVQRHERIAMAEFLWYPATQLIVVQV
eukprot:CAMPEP_0115878618 /NCGR_PEP_ID=MMETSP0287-20121206/26871_1 /TAXON_ID=412157 /ORGANISM="Chrysochromulina rotalis, Strain UIO044" /LENGTH=74 /DNA_ID=CAMNT_0003334249 /DNA_START=311 /DNA_END=536 /DNA_ORIENTATION=-